ncbi:redoxin family protein [Dysgonomonas sp. Marseille-P4677]|uniref:TlpA family protein disulfide reductase n=1 Tax=Dysgonomonas sp. Marseille-P4677 TaxID=2364790 RepID=UPI001913B83F|nr:TlpA family protein disulfide reductase [Dysgonomonas sp. Marseille-P4677]MBK5722348.1 redoxin family protein [Dysgonomonas sp. Marseille-P4677]
MKHVSHLLAPLFIGLMLIQCLNIHSREINKPEHGLKNTQLIEINKVLLTDLKTVVYIDVHSRPNVRINIDSTLHLSANNKKYLIVSTEGINLGEDYKFKENKEDHFILTFEPLPEGTKSFDLIEGDCDNCYRIWDVDLTDKKQAYKPDIPSELLTQGINKDARFPAPEFKMGKTKVTLHVTGLKDAYKLRTVKLGISNLFTGGYDEVEGKKETDGKYLFEIEQYVTANAFLQVGGAFCKFLLNPGENAEIYLDMTGWSKNKSRYNPQKDLQYIAFKSDFANVNNQLADMDDNGIDLQITNFKDNLIVDMSKQEYLDKISNSYKEKLASINTANINSFQKQYLKNELKSNVAAAFVYIDYYFTSSYRSKHKLDKKATIDYKAPVLEKEDLLKLKEIGLNDSLWVYSRTYSNVANAMTSNISKEILDDITGTGILQDLRKCLPLVKKAISMQALSADEEATLKSAANPYYLEVYNTIYNNTKKQYDSNVAKGGFVIETTPEVSGDQILEAIVAKHKGKVVFVDFWATWCVPCLNSMKKIKEIKPEMVGKDVVTIYITNATSPKTKWTSMLPDIGGIHYYLNEKQWEGLGNKHGFKGIPTYMIFDKSGQKSFQKSGYPGNETMIEELSKLW